MLTSVIVSAQGPTPNAFPLTMTRAPCDTVWGRRLCCTRTRAVVVAWIGEMDDTPPPQQPPVI